MSEEVSYTSCVNELEKQLPVLKKRTLSLKQLQHKNNLLGATGEHIAVTFLKQKQFSIIDTNLRWKQLEVDIIAKTPDGQVLVFVEVKTRRATSVHNQFGPLFQAYDYKKRIASISIGGLIAAKMNWHGPIRFDLITISVDSSEASQPKEINHYEYVNW